MTDVLKHAGERPHARVIEFAFPRWVDWFKTARHRNTAAIPNMPDDRLRDIGLLDGRGPSLRRPERNAVPGQ